MPAEMSFLSSLSSILSEDEWITNAKAHEATEKSDSSVKRFMRNLTSKSVLKPGARQETDSTACHSATIQIIDREEFANFENAFVHCMVFELTVLS